MMHLLRRTAPCVLLALAATACESGGTGPGEGGTDITWLRQNAKPLRTTEPGGDDADMEPLRQMVAGAHVVALGEATHGTREFFRMKHRTVEFLVRELGYNTFAIEAPWAEANRINHYIHTGEGDPEVLLSQLKLWPWNTAEVLEMIEWMRQHNQNPGTAPRVSFRGFDVQFASLAMFDVLQFLEGVNPASADSAEAHYACYRPWLDSIGQNRNYGATPATHKENCRWGVEAAYAQVQAGQAAYTAATSAAAYDEALRGARIVVQNEHIRRNPVASSGLRDQYMAETAQWIAGAPGSGRKTVLWAHNGHVARRDTRMGVDMAERYGEAYRPVGFSFWRGTFSVVIDGGPLGQGTAPAAEEDSYEHQFHRVGMPRFMVDLRPVRAGQAPGAAWLAGPMRMRSIGALYHPGYPLLFYYPVALAAEYDVLIHVEESTPTQLLPFRFN